MIKHIAALLLVATPALAQDIGPGETPLSMDDILAQFSQTCVANLPKFGKAPAELAKQGFVQNPKTTTWFHQKLNLSFKLTAPGDGGECSMVFASDEDPEAIGLGLAIASGSTSVYLDPDTAVAEAQREDKARFSFDVGAQLAGKQYFHAILAAAA